MAESFRFWTHGVQVIPEFTKEYTNTDNNLYMRRAGWGTVIKQKPKTENWFHMPLTSATSLDGDFTTINAVFLKAEISKDAVIKRIHVTMIDQSAKTPGPIMLVQTNVNITNKKDVFTFKFPKRLDGGAINLSVLVEFKTRDAKIIFRSAGANIFEE
jgi:hypothetical protein